jgi:thiol-disulfide isomerase/thioredoxin
MRAPAVGFGPLWLLLVAGCASVPEASPKVPSGARTVTVVGDRPVTVAAGEPGASQSITADPEPPIEADRRIAGRVLDEDGDPVPDAVIRLAVDGTGAGRSVEVTTDPAGRFGLSSLRKGSEYTLIAEWQDERGELRTGRRVVVAPETNVEIVLRSRRRAGRVGTASDRREVDADDEDLARPGAPKLADEAPRPAADEPPPARAAEDLIAGEPEPAPEPEPGAETEPFAERMAPEPAERGASPAAAGAAWRRGGSIRPAGEPAPPAAVSARPADAGLAADDEGPNPLPPAREPRAASGLAGEPIREASPVRSDGLAGSGAAPPPFPPDPSERRPAPVTPPEPVAASPTPAAAAAPSEALIDAALKGQGGTAAPAIAPEPPTPVAPAVPVTPAEPAHEAPPASGSGPAPEPAPAPPAMPDLGPSEPPKDAAAAPPAADEAPAPPPNLDAPGGPSGEVPPVPEPQPQPDNPSPDPEPAPPAEPEAPPPIADAPADPPAPDAPAPEGEPAKPEPAPEPTPKGEGGEGAQAAARPAPGPRMTWGQLSAQVEHAMRPPPSQAVERVSLEAEAARPARAAVPAAPATFTQASCRYDARHRKLEAFTLADVGGKPVRLADLDADLVLLDFWGTWCGPCLKAIPELVDLQAEYGPRLQVVGIAYEQGEPEEWPGRIGAIADRLGVNYTLLVGEADGRPCPLRAAMQVQAFPTLVLVDRGGQVLWRDQGATPANVGRLRRVIDARLNAGLAARTPRDEAGPTSAR